MYICKNCGQSYPEPVNFCGKCGGNSFDANDYNVNNDYNMNAEYSPYGNPTPAYNFEPSPAPESESKAPAIVGMACGASAVLIALWMMSICFSYIGSYHSYYYVEETFATLLGCSFFITPLAIVGLIMSFKSGSALKGMSIAGKITSFVSIGILGLTFLACVGNAL